MADSGIVDGAMMVIQAPAGFRAGRGMLRAYIRLRSLFQVPPVARWLSAAPSEEQGTNFEAREA